MQKIIEWLVVGIIIALPFLVLNIFFNLAMGLTSFWEKIFIEFSIEEYYFGIMGPVLMFLVFVGIGFLISSDFIHGIVGRILRITRVVPYAGPFAEKTWLMMRSIAKRIVLVLRGGYKRVIFEEHGRGRRRWKPAFVIGKTVFKYKGREELMLVVITPQLQIPDPKWVPPEDTRIVSGGIGQIGLLLLSGGFVNPDELKLEDWTKEKYEEIPEYKEEGLPAPKEQKPDNGNDGGDK